MAPNTTIGAASIVGGGGEDLPETLARKITNDAVARIRSLANERGRNADWAESAVRDAASVDAAEAVSMDPPVVDILAADDRRAVRGDRHAGSERTANPTSSTASRSRRCPASRSSISR